MKKFLQGCHSMDEMFFKQKAILKNIPLMVGLIGWYNISVEKYGARAILAYCQALNMLAPHV